jgi:hypothetical protein
MGIETFTSPPSFGRLTGQGAGAAWKARGTREGVEIVSSAFRHYFFVIKER